MKYKVLKQMLQDSSFRLGHIQLVKELFQQKYAVVLDIYNITLLKILNLTN
jgi:hypothetical protein